MYNPNETVSVNGITRLGQPAAGTSLNSVVPNCLRFSDSAQHANMPAWNSAMCNGPCGISHVSHEELDCILDSSLLSGTELDELIPDDWSDDIIFHSPVGSNTTTEHEYMRSSSLSTFDSLLSDSTILTCPTITSTPEQPGTEEAEGVINSSSVEAANYMGIYTDGFAGLTGSPALHPAYEFGHPEGRATSHDFQSVFAPVGSNNVTNSGAVGGILPAESCLSGSVGSCCRTCTGCHDPRLTSSEVGMKHFFKGVKKKKNSDRWTCEIRISKKIPKDGNLKADKLWLGTFDTRDEAARALHVGKYLLSVKTSKSETGILFDQHYEKGLKNIRDLLHAQPLDAEVLENVRSIAKHYGKTGSL